MSLRADKMKRGDTFLYTVTGKDILGADVVLDDYDVAADMRDADDNLVEHLTVDKITGTANAVISAAYALTAEWPTGDLVFDVQFTKDGVRVSTVTITQPVQLDQTHTP